jgi:hypothetical protein
MGAHGEQTVDVPDRAVQDGSRAGGEKTLNLAWSQRINCSFSLPLAYRNGTLRRYFRADAAFAMPGTYAFLEAEGFK